MKNIRILITIEFLVFSFAIMAQNENKISKCATEFDSLSNRNIYIMADIMPEFPGGSDSLVLFLIKNLEWPKDEADYGGTIYASFIVETDGTLTYKKIIRGVYDRADKEVLRVIDIMPKWVAGKCKEKAVPVKCYLPIKFILN